MMIGPVRNRPPGVGDDMEPRKIFITGMSGYLGTCLCRELDRLDSVQRFLGMDLRAPLYKFNKGEFRRMDVTDPGLADWVSEVRPDVFIHLAYVVEQSHDEKLMRRVNFEGSRNALQAAARAEVPQVLVASSGTAYGAWPDNPARLKENDPLRPNPGFLYAVDKARVEKLCQEFLKERPRTILSLIRPCVVYGPGVNNYLSDLLTGPLLMSLRGYQPPLQFIHEDDVVGAILRILERRAQGPFNLAPPDTVSMEEVFALAQRLALWLPDWLATPLVKLEWALHIPMLRVSPAFLDYIRYSWAMDSTRLRDELGYRLRYSTRETVEIMLRAKGILP